MALGVDRPPVAGVLAFSGFVPVVEGWQPDLDARHGTRAFIAHGRADPIIEISFARRARELLETGGLEVEYRESGLGHRIDPVHLPLAADWLQGAVPVGAE
jgi:phospholipase/carboxylesterase